VDKKRKRAHASAAATHTSSSSSLTTIADGTTETMDREICRQSTTKRKRVHSHGSILDVDNDDNSVTDTGTVIDAFSASLMAKVFWDKSSDDTRLKRKRKNDIGITMPCLNKVRNSYDYLYILLIFKHKHDREL
jgi:hypothetical protein